MPSIPNVATNVTYQLQSNAQPLVANVTGNGAALKWYTNSEGQNFSSTAPTPSTKFRNNTLLGFLS